MKKLKVMTVVGTRPEIIRLSRVLAKLDVGRALSMCGYNQGRITITIDIL